jgi:tetratricopeptide (TPR) repeat protein
MWGEIISGEQVHPGGGEVNLTTDEWHQRWMKYRELRPDASRIAIDSGEAAAWHRRQGRLAQHGNDDFAVAWHMNRMLLLDPQDESRIRMERALALIRDERYGEAAGELGRALESGADLEDSLEVQSLFDTNWRDSIVKFTWELVVRPDVAPEGIDRSQVVTRLVEVLQKGAASDPSWLETNRIAILRGAALVRSKNEREAIPVLEPHAQRGDTVASLFLSLAHWQLDEHEPALTHFEKALAVSDEGDSPRPEETLLREAWRTALERSADETAIRRRRAAWFSDRANWIDALADYNALLAADPADVELLLDRAAIHEQLQQWREAIDDCTRAVELTSGDSRAVVRRAKVYLRCYIQLREWEQAESDFSTLLELQEDSADFRRSRGRCRFALGHWVEAEEDYTRAIELNGDAYQYWHARGLCRLARGATNDAIADLSRAIDLNDKSGYTWRFRAKAYAVQQRWELASADYARAIELFPLSIAKLPHDNIFREWALVLLMDDRINDFHITCDRFRAHLRPMTRLVEVNALVSQSQTEASERRAPLPSRYLVSILDEAAWTLTLGPGALSSDDEWARLAVSDAIRKVYAAAEQVAEQTSWLTTLGAIEYRTGRFEQAVAVLDQAVQASPDAGIPRTWVLLSLVHGKLGHDEQAKSWYDKADAWIAEVSQSSPLVPVGSESDQISSTAEMLRAKRLTWDRLLELKLLQREAARQLGIVSSDRDSK